MKMKTYFLKIFKSHNIIFKFIIQIETTTKTTTYYRSSRWRCSVENGLDRHLRDFVLAFRELLASHLMLSAKLGFPPPSRPADLQESLNDLAGYPSDLSFESSLHPVSKRMTKLVRQLR